MEQGARSLSEAIPDVLLAHCALLFAFLFHLSIDIPLTVNNAGKECVDLLLALLALCYLTY